ncbi:MAG: hypothetical protein OXG33_11255 [Chloroflexi bacterium]|nr:hypothetical protein [Chloroflexota bacterium]
MAVQLAQVMAQADVFRVTGIQLVIEFIHLSGEIRDLAPYELGVLRTP